MTSEESARRLAEARRTEVRIALETADSGEPPEVLPQIVAAGLNHWRVEPLSADVAGSWLVVGDAGVPAGTATYARRVHTLVQRLLDTGAFERVEGDVPVTAYTDGSPRDAAGAFGGGENLPGTEELDWARRAIRCSEAWAVPPAPGGSSRGAGISIGHPDTGYSLHPGLGVAALDLARDWDAISDDDDARDPLIPPDQSPWPLPSPGHGTKTGSVIAGRGPEATGVVGVAPEATLVPIRAVESVVQLFDSDVARAVDHARRSGCRVISMSLGGKGFFGLEKAIQRAVDDGVIVMAAAGNKVGLVVAPASYENCIAVAATGIGDRVWPGSSHGRAVDVSAPGWSVHVANIVWDAVPPTQTVSRSSGTSFAVAHLAGVAALWLAHHTVGTIEARFGRDMVQSVFLHQLRTVGCRVPPGWDDDAWGVGVVDAEALVTAPLPAVEDVARVGAFGAGGDPLSRLARLIDMDREDLRSSLSNRLALDGAALVSHVSRFEGELAYLLLEDPDFREAIITSVGAGAFGAAPVPRPAAASPDLAAALH